MEIRNGIDSIPESTEIAVVGGGFVGLELARALEGRADVVVLESGPADDLRHINTTLNDENAMRLWLSSTNDPYFHRPWESRTPPHYAGNSGLRRRLGGRSLYWYGTALPMDPWALSAPEWPDAVVTELCDSWRGGPSLHERTAELLGVAPAFRRLSAGDDGGGDALRIGDFRFLPVPRAVRRGSGEAGRWHAYSPLDGWRDPTSGRVRPGGAGVQVRTSVDVLRVDVHGGWARGVTVRDRASGAERTLVAARVVLCAGTIENSRLAIQARHEVAPGTPTRLPRLADHLVRGFVLAVDDVPATSALRRLRRGAHVVPGDGLTRSNLFLHVVRSSLASGELLVEVRCTGEQLPDEASAVVCEPSADWPWRTTVETALSPGDRDMVAQQRATLDACWAALAAELGRPYTPLDFDATEGGADTPADLVDPPAGAGSPRTYAGRLGTEDHEGGTLPLGEVLTKSHELTAVPGLYAAGPSVFPRIGAANPVFTSLALTHRLAAILSEATRS